MQPAQAHQIKNAIDRFAADPKAPNNNVTSLKGLANGYRIRAGGWRASVQIDETGENMEIF
jgi:mRNA-degrading endonuclease RelE of RelBE toxin-antitoxin system